MISVSKVTDAMITYYGKDLRRINHFLKVFAFSKTIGELERLNSDEQYLLEVTALVHDIGIKESEKKYNSSAGKYQEIEGISESKKLLSSLGFENEFIKKVQYLVGHHHTYSNIDTLPYQILVEADFLVNLYEDGVSKEAVNNVKDKIFKTSTGLKLLKNMYNC